MYDGLRNKLQMLAWAILLLGIITSLVIISALWEMLEGGALITGIVVFLFYLSLFSILYGIGASLEQGDILAEELKDIKSQLRTLSTEPASSTNVNVPVGAGVVGKSVPTEVGADGLTFDQKKAAIDMLFHSGKITKGEYERKLTELMDNFGNDIQRKKLALLHDHGKLTDEEYAQKLKELDN